MWELVSELEVEDGRDDDMYRAIVSGWGSAELADSAEGAIARFQLLIAIPGMEDSIGRFRLQQIRRLIESEETIQLARCVTSRSACGVNATQHSRPTRIGPSVRPAVSQLLARQSRPVLDG